MHTERPEQSSREQAQDPEKSRVPSITLPKGGGALRSIDEKLTTNPANGTCELSIPLPFSKTRSGLDGAVLLRYDSGAGNGPFGLGWSLTLPSIQRSTGQRLPQYEDDDIFSFTGAEDLVPMYVRVAGAWQREPGRYRPRIEGLFSRIERVDSHWKVTTRDNVVTIFGRTAAARIADPDDPRRIFRWLPEETFDDKGNRVEYVYKSEDLANVPDVVEEKNRRGLTQANRYLKRIRYGNTTPGAGPFLFEAVFDYGDEGTLGDWPCRFDPFSDFRAGFEVRNYRLCRRILFFHSFPELDPQPLLVRSIDLTYQHFDFGATPYVGREVDLLETIRRVHYTKTASRQLPPLTLSYNLPVWNKSVASITSDDLLEVPAPYQWIDLYGDGVPGMLTEQGNAWYFKQNEGGGHFARARAVAPKPSLIGVGNGTIQIQDLDADGRKQVVSNAGLRGYFELTDENEWLPFRAFEQLPTDDPSDKKARLLDLDGDGKADLLIADDHVFRWYPSLGTRGYDAPRFASKTLDEERGPAMLFANGAEAIFTGDMNGDGLADVVRVRNGEVCYWPNQGYGRFGAKVSMRNAPQFDHPERFNPTRVQLADVTGTGAMDLIYLGRGGFVAWINLSGNAWSEPETIHPFPGTEPPNRVTMLDLLGNGTTAIVWESDLPAHTGAPIRYVDLMGGRKPYLLTAFANNLGKETRLEYRSSTYFARLDRKAGKLWATKLPFPTMCLTRTELRDSVRGSTYMQQWRYRHGYFDHEEREFRGFGMVETIDTESFDRFTPGPGKQLVDASLQQPAKRTCTWYHTGAYIRGARILDLFGADYFTNPVHPEHTVTGDVESIVPLTADEQRQAARACKGMILRQEIYANDGTPDARFPYSTVSHGRSVRMLQPALGNPFAVFLPFSTEAITYHYERDLGAPRVAHELSTFVDEIGNVTETASVVYGRATADGTLPADIQIEQARIRVIYSITEHTNDVITPAAYRLRQRCKSERYEVLGIAPTGTYFTRAGIRSAFAGASTRLLSRERVLFAQNANPETALGPGVLESLGLPYESYRLALTPTLRTTLYGTRVTDPMLAEGKYVADADGWWVPSGRVRYPLNPEQHFYLPDRYVNPFGETTTVHYHGTSHLLIDWTEDPLGNRNTILAFDFRFLEPQSVRDINDNIVEVRFDIAGFVAGRAERGKGAEGDDFAGFDPDPPQASVAAFLADPAANGASLLQQATVRYVYDFSTLPVVAATITRETHHAVAAGAVALQFSFDYSDGLGRVVMRKVQAEAGKAKQCTVNPDGTYTITEVDTGLARRWVGSGRTIRNNKGNRVMEYEPYFSATHRYEDAEELVETGVTPRIRYDALDRDVRTDFPDGSFSSVEFDAWQRRVYDGNDNVIGSDWHTARIGGGMGALEQSAAQKAALHDDTPVREHYDSLGRSILIINHNKFVHRVTGLVTEELYETRTRFDIEGQRLQVIDDRGNDVMRYTYDLAGRAVVTTSMDGGERRAFPDIAGEHLYAWDAKGNRFHTLYDTMRRPIAREVLRPDATTVMYERLEYGTDKTENQNGLVIAHFDGSGVVRNLLFDFKGNLRETSRTFTADAAATPDWTTPAAVTLQPRTFATTSSYDVLNRIVTTTTPDGSVSTPHFGFAASLTSLDVSVRGAPAKTFVSGIVHDAKGQRLRVTHGNDVVTETSYDNLTFRIRRIHSVRPMDGAVMQDLNYTYDPAGNVTSVRDLAHQPVYFNGAVALPHNNFVYDAVYRLISATGREAIGLNAPVSQFDRERTAIVHKADGSAVQNYRQQYDYDSAGNIRAMVHSSGTGSFTHRWTRTFDVTATNNRLDSSQVGMLTETHTYDLHGNMTELGDWDFRDRLRHANLGGGGDAYYTYDAENLRTRKVILRPGGIIEERLYLGNVEIFTRRHNGTTDVVRETLHIMDGPQRAAMIETRVSGTDPGPAQLAHYVFSNHLGTSTLELDHAAAIISYEEYHPFGSTSFQSVDAGSDVPAKRYRYSGKERDEETGLYDHGARYYAPWLARWTAPDPKGLEGGTNLYSFALDNPVKFFDPDGRDVRLSVDQQTHTITYSTTVHVFATRAEIRRLTPMARQAEQFFANPRIETQAETQARQTAVAAGQPAPAGRAPVFVDASGTRWTVRFDVQYQFHDIARTPPTHSRQTLNTAPAATTFVNNQRAEEARMTTAFGYQPGDNVMTLTPQAGSTGGVTSLMTSANPAMPTFGEPHSRMFASIARSPRFIQESLIHETGHLLGFDERYEDFGPLSQSHPGFDFDFMGAGTGRSEITMHPVHIEAAGRFAVDVANHLNLSSQVIRGIQVDDTGTGGNIPMTARATTGPTAGQPTPYEQRQQTLRTELLPHFRSVVTGTQPPPPPPPMPHRMPYLRNHHSCWPLP
ncbi:MAG TPA: SpvB/TcaC N-terminal domain-containing protein [Thermoanaerobaculia bacterium]|nr:SpvB/TcaC N-terminal domain-containing protein [Thermoanaerobaculia bacterium]